MAIPDPDFGALSALRRLRRIETDTARRDLADALARETALAARNDALRRELGEARQYSGDFDREAFIAWFDRERAELEHIMDAIRAAAATTAAARTDLARRQVAEGAAAEALVSAMAAREAVVARRDQVMLEDVARALKRAAERDATSDKDSG